MFCSYACNSAEHALNRRGFLQGLTAGMAGVAGFSGMVGPTAAAELAASQKQVVVFYLAGGVSQLETWDPKPGTDTGGPFDKIQTSAPGLEISELLPYTAQQMHHLSVIRSINHKEGDHGKGDYIMQTGRRQEPGPDPIFGIGERTLGGAVQQRPLCSQRRHSPSMTPLSSRSTSKMFDGMANLTFQVT